MNAHVRVTIEADVDTVFLPHLFEAIRNAVPIPGGFTFEVDAE